MIAIPTSIDPDLLKDSIVEIRFNSDLDFALVPGLVYHSLIKNGYQYNSGIINPIAQPNQFVFNLAQPTFVNEFITCRITGNSLIYNFKTKYIGWKKYYSEITDFLRIIEDLQIVRTYSRIGLRYINILRETNVYEKLIDELRVNLKSLQNVATNIKTEIVHPEFKINVNLGNDFRLPEPNEKVSVIDIDVFLEKEINKLDELLTILDHIHTAETEVFFTVLKPEFVQTLKPNYDR